MLHAVGIQLGIGDLEVDHRVDLHGHVILGDDRLGSKVRHLLLQRDFLGNAFNKGNFQVQPHIPDRAERTQTLHHIGTGLLNDDDVADYQNQKQDNQDGDNDPLHNT